MDAVTLSLVLAACATILLFLRREARQPNSHGLDYYGAVALLVFMVSLLVASTRPDLIIRRWPAPTEALASIISGLAWPVVGILVVLLFFRDLGVFVSEVNRRLLKGKGMKTPWGELADIAETDPADPSRKAIMILLRYPDSVAQIQKWLTDNLPGVNLVDFYGQDRYRKDRENCLESLT